MAMWGEDLMDQTSDTFRMLVPMPTMTMVVAVLMGIVVSICAGVTHWAPTFPALRLVTGAPSLRFRINCAIRVFRTHVRTLSRGNEPACIRR